MPILALLLLCWTQALAVAVAAPQRQLLDSTQAHVVISIVNSMDGFFDALAGGAQHIQIRSHLDATSFPLIKAVIQGNEFQHLLPPQTARTRSIRGNCTTAPSKTFLDRISGAPMDTRNPAQCVILAQSHLLAATEGTVLVDNIYIRYADAGSAFGFETSSSPIVPTLMHVHGGVVYGSNVRVQGDGTASCRGHIVYPTAQVIYVDSDVSDMAGTVDDKGAAIVPVAVRSSPTSFLRCVFRDNDGLATSPVILGDVNAPVRLQECSFANNTATVLLRALAGSVIYSDDQQGQSVLKEADDEVPPQPLSSARGLEFLSDADDWLIEMRELLAGPAIALPVAEALLADNGVGPDPTAPLNSGEDTGTPPSSNTNSAPDAAATDIGTDSSSDNSGGGGGDDNSTVWIVIVVVAVVVILSALTAIFILRRRARARNASPAAPADLKPLPSALPPLPMLPTNPHYAPQQPPYAPPYGTVHQAFSTGHPGSPGVFGYGPPGPPSMHPSAAGSYQQGLPPPQQQQVVPLGLQYQLQHGGGSWASGRGSASPSVHSGTPPGGQKVGGAGQMWGVPFPDADATFTDEAALYGLVANPYNSADVDSMTHATLVSNPSRASRPSMGSMSETRAGRGGGGGDPGPRVGPLPEGADAAQRLERLCVQLDGMYAVGKQVMQQYSLLGDAHRRVGGQGLVQFARGPRDDTEYALKFFISKQAFDAETQLYHDDVLRDLLPNIEVLSGNEDGREGDAHGIPLPPFIVMEKGEALDEWSRRAKPDLFQSVAMLANISRRLAGMHGAGYVHRDLKPGNVMWLPRENRWTIIDFGCVAKAGESAGICYSLRYTAPEVMQSLRRRERAFVPQPSLDAWSLGVMAFELLTGKPAFPPLIDGTQQILAQLLGEQDLPWEGTRADPSTMRKLRSLRAPVMSLLDRNPTKRPSLQEFCNMCDDIFGTRTVGPT